MYLTLFIFLIIHRLVYLCVSTKNGQLLTPPTHSVTKYHSIRSAQQKHSILRTHLRVDVPISQQYFSTLSISHNWFLDGSFAIFVYPGIQEGSRHPLRGHIVSSVLFLETVLQWHLNLSVSSGDLKAKKGDSCYEHSEIKDAFKLFAQTHDKLIINNGRDILRQMKTLHQSLQSCLTSVPDIGHVQTLKKLGDTLHYTPKPIKSEQGPIAAWTMWSPIK